MKFNEEERREEREMMISYFLNQKTFPVLPTQGPPPGLK
jgi:hypothetical protein